VAEGSFNVERNPRGPKGGLGKRLGLVVDDTSPEEQFRGTKPRGTHFGRPSRGSLHGKGENEAREDPGKRNRKNKGDLCRSQNFRRRNAAKKGAKLQRCTGPRGEAKKTSIEALKNNGD